MPPAYYLDNDNDDCNDALMFSIIILHMPNTFKTLIQPIVQISQSISQYHVLLINVVITLYVVMQVIDS